MTKIVKITFKFKLNEVFEQNPDILKDFLKTTSKNFKKEFQIESEIEKKLIFIED